MTEATWHVKCAVCWVFGFFFFNGGGGKESLKRLTVSGETVIYV